MSISPRWLKYSLAAIGAGGFIASLALLYSEMRQILQLTGGACASGGPYVIAHPCPAGAGILLTLSVFGMMVSGAVFAGAVAWSRGPVVTAIMLMWSALFGVLGYNFLSLDNGSVVCGAVFELMASAGLVPVVLNAAARRAGRGPGAATATATAGRL